MTLTNSVIKIEAITGDYVAINEQGLYTTYPNGVVAQCLASATSAVMSLAGGAGGNFIQGRCEPAGASTLEIMSNTADAAYVKTNGYISAPKYRFTPTFQSVSIPASVGIVIQVYNEAGALLGKIPVIP